MYLMIAGLFCDTWRASAYPRLVYCHSLVPFSLSSFLTPLLSPYIFIVLSNKNLSFNSSPWYLVGLCPPLQSSLFSLHPFHMVDRILFSHSLWQSWFLLHLWWVSQSYPPLICFLNHFLPRYLSVSYPPTHTLLSLFQFFWNRVLQQLYFINVFATIALTYPLPLLYISSLLFSSFSFLLQISLRSY